MFFTLCLSDIYCNSVEESLSHLYYQTHIITKHGLQKLTEWKQHSQNNRLKSLLCPCDVFWNIYRCWDHQPWRPAIHRGNRRSGYYWISKPSQAKPSQAKPSQAKPSQAKVLTEAETCPKCKSTSPCFLAIPAFDRIAGLRNRQLNSNREYAYGNDF